MELRASFLMGTDVVALGLWPEHAALGPEAGLPVEVVCVDQAIAEIVESLTRRYAALDDIPGGRPGRWLLQELVAWAEAEAEAQGNRPRPGR